MGLTLQSATDTFLERFRMSGSLGAEASAVIPGGYSRGSLNFGPHAIYVDRGEGQFIHTVEGHQLVDFHNNFSCNVLGHNHPAIRDALLAAVPRGFSFANPMAHEHTLAQILVERIDSVEKLVFTCSASEACISAVRIARAFTGKDKVAKMEGGYHGIDDDFMISLHPDPAYLAGPAGTPVGVPNTGGIPLHTVANVVVLPQNDLASCERVLSQNAGDVACVILELQCGAGGVIEMEEDFVRGLREITKALGILLIIDETITLRSSYSGLQSDYGVTPDLTVMGKIIGGGLPLGAVGGSCEVMALTETGVVYHSGTHHGHPLATAAGIACMEVMTKNAYKRLIGFGDRIRTELNTWAAGKDYPFFVNGRGTHLGYEICDEPGRVYRSCRDMFAYSDEEKMQTFAFEMANRGLFPMYRGQIALSEPMGKKDIDMFIRLSKDILEEMFTA